MKLIGPDHGPDHGPHHGPHHSPGHAGHAPYAPRPGRRVYAAAVAAVTDWLVGSGELPAAPHGGEWERAGEIHAADAYRQATV